jgi:RimJ/RimL family protein N-acetyltransferase
VVGSVVFHGFPDDGVAEIGYGVEHGAEGQGLATEAALACVEWALTQRGIVAVCATTLALHRASLRIIEKLGMRYKETRDHELLGELLVFERRR